MLCAILCKNNYFDQHLTESGIDQISLTFRFIGTDLVLNNNSNNNKKKETRTPRGSSGSVLTFSNPNYNVAEGDIPVEPKAKVWKRMKYDKAQVDQSLVTSFLCIVETIHRENLLICHRNVFGKNDVLMNIQQQ